MFNGRFALARHQRQSLLAVLAATVIAGALALAAIGPFRSVAEPDTPIPVRLVQTTAAVAATDTGRTSAPEADIEARSLQIEEPAAPATADGRANDRARATNPPPTAPPPTAPPPTEPAPTDPPETPSSATQPPETLPPETQPTVTLPPETRPSQTQPTVTQPTPTPTDTEPTVTPPTEPKPTIPPLPTISIPQPPDGDGDD